MQFRILLRHRQQFQEPPAPAPKKGKGKAKQHGFTALRKYFDQLLCLFRRRNNIDKKCIEDKEELKCANKIEEPKPKKTVIPPDTNICSLLPDKLYKIEEEEQPKPPNRNSGKHRVTKKKPFNVSSCENRRRELVKDDHRKSKRSRNHIYHGSHSSHSSLSRTFSCRRRLKKCKSLCSELLQKTSEVNALYAREHVLTKRLTYKCELYKRQNQLYTQPEKNLELSVGKIQRNIEAYAQEIIATEHELMELKNQIKEDISIIQNLKRLTLRSKPHTQNSPNMQFVDNIYEFCDNNASMIV